MIPAEKLTKELEEAIGEQINRLQAVLENFENRRSAPRSSSSRLAQIQIRLSVFRSSRDLVLLWMWRKSLPIQIRMEIEAHLGEESLSSTDLRRIMIRIRDRIQLQKDRNYLNGRVLSRILFLLRKLPVNLVEPPRPKRAERIRGYRDHGSRRPSHENHGVPGRPSNLTQELHQEYLQRQLELEEIATNLLLREREGSTLQANVELATTERKEQAEARKGSFKDLSDEALVKLSQILKEKETSPKEIKPLTLF